MNQRHQLQNLYYALCAANYESGNLIEPLRCFVSVTSLVVQGDPSIITAHIEVIATLTMFPHLLRAVSAGQIGITANRSRSSVTSSEIMVGKRA